MTRSQALGDTWRRRVVGYLLGASRERSYATEEREEL